MIILPSSISAYIRSIANLSVSFVYAFIPHQRRFIFLMLRFLVCRISWVHRDDLVSLIMESLSNPAYEGVINGTAPNPVRVNEMCDRLGAVLGRPSWLPVPEFALRVLLGEGASVVLEGQRVLPKKAQELGFTYKYRFISDALKASLSA
jgi:NAD dependent epimerase/dehydratase family enzyme